MELVLERFLIYAAVLLLCGVVLAVVSSRMVQGFAVQGKTVFWYSFFASLLTALAAFLVPFATTDPFWIFWLLGGLYLVAGMVHNRFSNRRFRPSGKAGHLRTLALAAVLGGVVICFSLLAFSALHYFLRDQYFLFYPVLMSALLFFMPMLVWHSFLAAYAIPETVYPTWPYPLNNPPEPFLEGQRDKILVIRLELAKTAASNKKTGFTAKVPETMRLGDFFFHFLAHYNDMNRQNPIEYVDDAFEPSNWLFHTKGKWYQKKRILNPEFSIRENELQEHMIIVCERRVPSRQPPTMYKKQMS